MDLTRVVAVANGKGGVGKTSLVSNLAGEFARAGLRILVVDLDVSANLNLEFGTVGHQGDDAGAGVYEAIVGGKPLHVVKDVRSGIDWIPGGARLNWILPLKFGVVPDLPSGSVEGSWREALGRVIDEGEYDMVLVDTAPGNRELQELALAAARWILVPLKSDPASWEGLHVLGPLVGNARKKGNPDLEWLGMVLFGTQTTATRVRQTVMDNLKNDAGIPFLNATLRASESTAQACRLSGMLVHEVAGKVDAGNIARLQALQARRADPSVEIPATISRTATSLAGDYAALAEEVAAAITRSEQTK